MIDFTSRCLRRDGKPWFPVMGEFHFSRYRPELWEEELRKMRAGGVSIVSTYVIWIHHEEERGVFDFTGCRDVRRFLLAAQRVGLPVFLRLGPWVHGEVRNGGFPDWLMEQGKTIRLRSGDPRYIAHVRAYWTKLAGQCAGMMLRDGGPVTGIQIENEYGHVGGLRGEEGEEHMRTLTRLARELGFETPLYTATGWGGAVTGGLLPVMGGYCEAPWAQTAQELPANGNYVFSHTRNDALIACDHDVQDGLTFDESRFPYLTAELGGGLQVTKHRRPVATGADIGAMSLAKLGSGVGMLGYYMYHGGSNPQGKRSTLQESRAAGDYNDLPEINYDFNAPIRQFGTISDTYRELRLLALFARDFGEDFAVLRAEIEPENVSPEDTHTLRVAWRHDETHGYVFVINYQRRRVMDAHPAVVLRGRCVNPVAFPATDVLPNEYFFLPYHMRLGGAVLESALATPLCRLDGAGEETVWVFYGDREPRFQWKDDVQAPVLHISRAEALKSAKVRLDRDYLIQSEDFVWAEEGRLVVTGAENTKLKAFPALKNMPEGFVQTGTDGAFTVYRRLLDVPAASVQCTLQRQERDISVYTLSVKYPKGSIPDSMRCDWLLHVAYSGESMNVFCRGKKINDYFYTGQPALLSLRYFDFPEELTLEVHALYEEDRERIFLERRPVLENGRACRIDSVRLEGSFTM